MHETATRSAHKSFDAPDEVREFPLGRAEILEIGGGEVGRYTVQPGWSWSQHMKPIAGTELCEAPHFQFHVAGTLRSGRPTAPSSTFAPARSACCRPAMTPGSSRRAGRRDRLGRSSHLGQGLIQEALDGTERVVERVPEHRVARRDPLDPEQVAERGFVRLEQLVVRKVRRRAEDEQVGSAPPRTAAAHASSHRGRDHGALAVAVAPAAVVVLEQMRSSVSTSARGPSSARSPRSAGRSPPRRWHRSDHGGRSRLRRGPRGRGSARPGRAGRVARPLRSGRCGFVGDTAAEGVAEPERPAGGRTRARRRRAARIPRRLPGGGAVT